MRLLFLISFMGLRLWAIEPHFGGQLSFWGSADRGAGSDDWLGLRYLPEFSVARSGFASGVLDGEVQLDVHGSLLDDGSGWVSDADGDIYRLWVRYARDQLEVRVGLQKINFGSATLLRPLMWFDRIDPRDPLALTDGVYGVLVRRYFLNNANIWAWGLVGNDEAKGWEVYPTDDDPEFGGRVQLPWGPGEWGISVHHRRAAGDLGAADGVGGFQEERFGVDGKWDVGVGLWMEAVIIRQDVSPPEPRYLRMVDVGCDHTFDWGNGLTVVLESFATQTAEEPWHSGDGVVLSAASLDYPLGLLDRLAAVFYFDWDRDAWYRFIDWQRKYDRWSFHAMGFWNPENAGWIVGERDAGQFSGRGFQLMVVFDH